ncbi:putative Eukaryotic translation initiation factor 1 [Trypanosoma cruzi]|uniref:Protein translation factor SUI1 homolog, putative n=3 Tax=Trypanosoma cruzi TaxID=5693 RepID=Q4DM75_TRYCC|nr:translation factor SUI1, putative [Trypanosoma cruzi]XP_819790.1 protein translation factor SUI1 homolog, putative [Trypanosoma cruzi]7ASE_V Chain V, Protein translation factor SUI1 homolog, putative [Trypanosoma cruzi]PBJ79899.1 Protein translation factor SUI1-like protein [Trypanosoma cruzi cruzi]EAN93618.1 translation factor SUI1, putative [Trypanosoma cruzi]EAN97939.1 protein translation factor SUI1 homolog, putative [Trypanosoma cruzi]KAF8287256.1 putative Eukaryotic translation initi|eukprot:XP_815469.1 translation factor SUI1 [Trypanosoma cruzi strain CL Brener]
MLNNELANLVDQQKRSVQDALEAQKVHIRVQQRKGKKFVTSVQGLNQALNFRRISREFQRRWGCNGTVIVTPDAGTVIQLQGNWSEEIKKFLLDENMATEQNLEIHSLN